MAFASRIGGGTIVSSAKAVAAIKNKTKVRKRIVDPFECARVQSNFDAIGDYALMCEKSTIRRFASDKLKLHGVNLALYLTLK